MRKFIRKHLNDLASATQAVTTRTDQSFGIVPILKKDHKYHFLLIKSKKGLWGFPKGHKHLKETDLQAATRELSEETGITNLQIIENLYFLESYDIKKLGIRIHKTVKFFPAFVNSTKVKIDNREVSHFLWVNYKEAQNLLTRKEFKAILDQAYKFLKSNS